LFLNKKYRIPLDCRGLGHGSSATTVRIFYNPLSQQKQRLNYKNQEIRDGKALHKARRKSEDFTLRVLAERSSTRELLKA